ncbi:DHA2 family efflux MFS transporter permease subunit [Caenibacillus caldisaponilyticus]|uniref:DHA2 family efflux MFS transporter permease subunit n=1 Tax=Caenibacillus caldisaponilyticus TaxID=1674942 RepID=UPI000988586B|nr:DHA2 family efflux MFS transporter permease subunit [Caenibacillus caldisaponilyticus]
MSAFWTGYTIFSLLVLIGCNLIYRRVKRRRDTGGNGRDTRIQAETANEENPASIKKGPIITVLILGAFVSILNQTLMNVALPVMMTDLNISANTAQWLTTGFMLVNGVLIPVSAFLMEKFTTRQLFITAMALFAAGTLLCAVSPNFALLMSGRVIQACGAGIIMPLMTNVFLTIFPVEKRGAAMGIIGLAMIFAPAVGPTLSGYIVEHYTWRVLFYIVFPFALLDVFLALALLKNVTKLTYPKLDYLGIVLSTIGFGGILYGFSEAGNHSWSSTTVILPLIVGLLALALFIWREFAVDRPMLEFRVFKYGMFSLAAFVNAVITMAMFAAMILLPIYLQNIRGFTPLESGLLLLPGALLMGLMSPVTGIIFDKIGPRALAVVGLFITTVTTYEFTRLTDETPYRWLLVLYSLRMFGMSMLMMPIMTTGLNALPQRLNAHGTAMVNTLRQVAGSLGTAFLVTVMSNRTDFHAAAYADVMTSNNPGFLEKWQTLSAVAPGGQNGATQILYGLVMKHATIQGINDAFLFATVLSIIALVFSIFLKKTRPPEDDGAVAEEKPSSDQPERLRPSLQD